MANLLHASRLRTYLGGRNCDYTEIYSPDKLGEEAKENARVWYVYLDEAGSHDADMIEGFQSIIESLLVFAALFSAVVTTFVAQTSQVLQPDNAQIMVSLLVETNQLLRAAGNRSSINAVPAASLGPQSLTYTSTDVWVNGLFFTSLALSLSTALLSVLAKQWIQAYTATVSGDAKTRAFIRQFRFEGLVKWKLGEIIESLPLILHCSVAVFLVGLALYVSQLSRPICVIVAAITALTFLFYFASSMLPAFHMACPYRIPFIFTLSQLILFAFYKTRRNCSRLWFMLTNTKAYRKSRPFPPRRPRMSRQPLKVAEHDAVLYETYSDRRLAHSSLGWVFNHSSNRLVKEIVVEGTFGLLGNWSQIGYHTIESLISNLEHNFLPIITYSLSRLTDTYSSSSMEDEIGNNKYGRLIETFMKAFHLRTLLDELTAGFQDWQEQIKGALFQAYRAALRNKHRVLSRWILDSGGPNLFQSDSYWNTRFLFSCMTNGNAEDLRELGQRGIDLNCQSLYGQTALHNAVFTGNLDMAIALVELEPALVSAQERHSALTALDIVIRNWYNPFTKSADISYIMLTYLLDRGAQTSHDILYDSLTLSESYMDMAKVKILLDCGWDRAVKDTEGKTLLDVARSKGDDTLIEDLEHYQTVRFAPYGMKLHTVNEETQ